MKRRKTSCTFCSDCAVSNLSFHVGAPLWQSQIWYREAKFLIFSVLSKGEAREGPKRVWNKLVITAVLREHLQHLKIELVSNVRNQKFAPLLLDRLRDLAEYTSKTEKGTISVSARVVHAQQAQQLDWTNPGKNCLNWSENSSKKRRRQRQAKNTGEKGRRKTKANPAAKTCSETFKCGLFRRKRVVQFFHCRVS